MTTTPAAAAPRSVPAWWRASTAELAIVLAAFAGLCIAVLTRSASLLEPDDFAYRASIVALTHGHLTLSTAEYQALSQKLGGIAQWVQLPNGRWISEKNPGYPFFAAPFQLLGILRLAPLFYGTLGCLGLFFGARRWLGRLGGAWAVAFFCLSGAAMVFAWRPTMPTFTDASLVAAGSGALLWAMLATDASARRRTLVGLAAFLALEGATFIRYTDVVVLGVAIGAVLLGRRAARVPFRSLAWWLGSVAAFGALVASFDALVYGGPTKTGYRNGEITFAFSAIQPNIENMPQQLVAATPAIVLALLALGWTAIRLVRGRHLARRRDAAVAAALGASWVAIYGLYFAYTWTVGQSGRGGISVHLIRFYVPALAAIALLAAWGVHQLPRFVPVLAVVAALVLGSLSYGQLASARGGPGGGPGFGPGGPGHFGGPPPQGFRPGGPPPGGFVPGGFRGAPPGG